VPQCAPCRTAFDSQSYLARAHYELTRVGVGADWLSLGKNQVLRARCPTDNTLICPQSHNHRDIAPLSCVRSVTFSRRWFTEEGGLVAGVEEHVPRTAGEGISVRSTHCSLLLFAIVFRCSLLNSWLCEFLPVEFRRNLFSN
jgi:hypothetical protein